MSRFPDYPGRAMIVHDGLKIVRAAVLIEERIKRIKELRKILRMNDDVPAMYRSVDPERVRQRLDEERQCLDKLLEDIEEGGLLSEIQSIRDEFVCN